MFSVDAGWPTLPAGTVLGEVSSIAVRPDDHVFALHRPRSVPEDRRAMAALPVLELDAAGRLVRSWGGPSDAYESVSAARAAAMPIPSICTSPYVVESANARVLIYERASMRRVGVFGSRGAAPGGMDIAHHIAVDSKGNLYTAEIVNNRRAQKFVAAMSSRR